MADKTPQPDPKVNETKTTSPRSKLWSRLALAFGATVFIVALIYGWLFTTTPAAVRLPQLEHAHIRFQLVVDGQPVNFGDDKFQTHYAQACSDNISPEPIHFHDGKDQFLHLHWKNVTGGLVLKNYGMNFIGGADDTLGYRFDASLLPTRVPIHGKDLPVLPAGAQPWVYTGDANSPKERSTLEFLNQDFETFLDTKSSVNQTSWLDRLLFTKAVAHDGEEHDTPAEATQHEAQTPAATTAGPVKDQAELARIQNMLGNVVVFVQKDKPADTQVTQRFNNFLPIPESSCGG